MPTNNRCNLLLRQNMRAAKKYGLRSEQLVMLRELTREFEFSIAGGELQLLNEAWYVTHSGLLALARRRACKGINVVPLREFCDPVASSWSFQATVYKSCACKGFVGHGDANPSNVSPLVRGAEMRVAETRAVNRALRKAYGIGICSIEEMGSFSGPLPAADQKKPIGAVESTNGNGHPLRDRLCLLIRQHQLDPSLVKAYAADYCDISELRKASRQQVATFIQHLGEYAQSDRDGLLCQLNSYAAKPVASADGTVSDAGAAKVGGAA